MTKRQKRDLARTRRSREALAAIQHTGGGRVSSRKRQKDARKKAEDFS